MPGPYPKSKGLFEWHAQICNIIRSFSLQSIEVAQGNKARGEEASLEAGSVIQRENGSTCEKSPSVDERGGETFNWKF